MSAAETIRASIEALPEGVRQKPWDSDYGFVLSSRYGTGGEVVADCLPGHLHDFSERKEMARHIARLASPHVATALADLLVALKEPTEKPVNAIAWLDEIILAGRALEATIDRSGT